MTFAKNLDGTFTVSLTAEEAAGLATEAKVRGVTEAEVLTAAAVETQKALAIAAQGLRVETVRALYKRIDVATAEQLVAVLNGFDTLVAPKA